MNNDFNLNFERFQLDNSYWNKYNNLINRMSNEQRMFVGKQEDVLQAKQKLISVFVDYLFEQYKGSFVNSSDMAQALANEYFEAVSKAAEKYVTRNDQLEKENAELKKQVKQLMLNYGKDVNDSTTEI